MLVTSMVKSAENPPPPRCQEEPHLLQVLGDLKDGTVSKVWTQEIGWFRTQNISQHRSGQQRFGQRITISPSGGASKAITS